LQKYGKAPKIAYLINGFLCLSLEKSVLLSVPFLCGCMGRLLICLAAEGEVWQEDGRELFEYPVC